MDTQTLRMFKAVADTGSISGAARELNYAQSNVSTKIKQLETDLKAPLFFRHNKGIKLTTKGEVFLKYANEMARILSEADRAMTEEDKPEGPLRIASMQTTASGMLPAILAEYHRTYPDVALQISTGPTDKNVRAVLDYEADCAFVSDPADHPALEKISVGMEHLVLLTDAEMSDEKLKEEIQDGTLLVFPRGCSYRRALETWLRGEGIVPKDIIEYDSVAGILAGVVAGLGITLLPESAAASYIDSGFLKKHELPPAVADKETVLIRRRHDFLPSSVKCLAELCRKSYSERKRRLL